MYCTNEPAIPCTHCIAMQSRFVSLPHRQSFHVSSMVAILFACTMQNINIFIYIYVQWCILYYNNIMTTATKVRETDSYYNGYTYLGIFTFSMRIKYSEIWYSTVFLKGIFGVLVRHRFFFSSGVIVWVSLTSRLGSVLSCESLSLNGVNTKPHYFRYDWSGIRCLRNFWITPLGTNERERERERERE